MGRQYRVAHQPLRLLGGFAAHAHVGKAGLRLRHLRLWHDLQSDSQNNGLMAFASGETPVCLPDGNPEEWTEKDSVFEAENGLALSARYDREGLYLLVEGLSADEEADIPIDISPEVGSAVCEDPALTFQREADFLLRLNGPEDSRLLVQERFDAMREQFHNEITGQNAYTRVPDLDSPRFVPVCSALENNTLVDEITPERFPCRTSPSVAWAGT